MRARPGAMAILEERARQEARVGLAATIGQHASEQYAPGHSQAANAPDREAEYSGYPVPQLAQTPPVATAMESTPAESVEQAPALDRTYQNGLVSELSAKAAAAAAPASEGLEGLANG